MFQDNLLTLEEVQRVDAALLNSKEKFTTRIALYALRVLQQIAATEGMAMAAVSAEQINYWIQQSPEMQQNAIEDASFVQFFVQLVTASLKPLHQAAAQAAVDLEQLSVGQVIQWFEQESRQQREAESLAAAGET